MTARKRRPSKKEFVTPSPADPGFPSPVIRTPVSKHSFPPAPTSQSQFYGFVVYLGSIVVFGAYLLWAFTPDQYIKAVGIDWYPHREWALLGPAWITMLVVFVYIFYAALNIYDTPPLTSLSHIVDTKGHLHKLPADPDHLHPIIANSRSRLQGDAIPELYDLPIGLVNTVLYKQEGDL